METSKVFDRYKFFYHAGLKKYCDKIYSAIRDLAIASWLIIFLLINQYCIVDEKNAIESAFWNRAFPYLLLSVIAWGLLRINAILSALANVQKRDAGSRIYNFWHFLDQEGLLVSPYFDYLMQTSVKDDESSKNATFKELMQSVVAPAVVTALTSYSTKELDTLGKYIAAVLGVILFFYILTKVGVPYADNAAYQTRDMKVTFHEDLQFIQLAIRDGITPEDFKEFYEKKNPGHPVNVEYYCLSDWGIKNHYTGKVHHIDRTYVLGTVSKRILSAVFIPAILLQMWVLR